jgi:hypothetical protein
MPKAINSPSLRDQGGTIIPPRNHCIPLRNHTGSVPRAWGSGFGVMASGGQGWRRSEREQSLSTRGTIVLEH